MQRHTPELQIRWEGRWHSFAGALRPALARSRRPLTSEIASSRFRLTSFFSSLLLHAIGLMLLSTVTVTMTSERPLRSQILDEYKVHFLPDRRLPAVADQGGAESGAAGRSGGRTAHHAVQTIRVAAGSLAAKVVVRAPRLQLPASTDPLANMLVIPPPVAPPAPAAAVKSARSVPVLPVQVIPPRADVSALQKSALRLESLPATALPPPVPKRPEVSEILMSTTRSVAAPQLPVSAAAPTPASQPETQPASAEDSAAALADTVPGPVPLPGDPASTSSAAFVISAAPGDSIGRNGSESGSLALATSGTGDSGAGGSGDGTGIGNGSGPGSGEAGTGPGSGPSGEGLGADPAATGGTSLAKGPGGAGEASGPHVPGISIQGGNVNLSSFATDAAANVPGTAAPGRNKAPITIIATASSGGAIAAYRRFHGTRVYTIYVETPAGTAVLQFAEQRARTGFDGELTAPDPVNVRTPAGPKTRLLVSCVLNKDGRLENIRVLETANRRETQTMLAFLQKWEFRPVLRGEEPIAVDALIGFAIGTR